MSTLYSGCVFELSLIEKSGSIKETMVIFENIKTKAQFSKNLSDIYNNKNLLKRFSSIDAYSISYEFNRLLILENFQKRNS